MMGLKASHLFLERKRLGGFSGVFFFLYKSHMYFYLHDSPHDFDLILLNVGVNSL